LSELLEPFRSRVAQDDDMELPLGLYLQSASPRETIARMLRNLKDIYTAEDDIQRVSAVDARLAVLLPTALSMTQ
jgi:regulator of sirC expression with transglutaminase-like and TPR domain